MSGWSAYKLDVYEDDIRKDWVLDLSRQPEHRMRYRRLHQVRGATLPEALHRLAEALER